MAGVVMLPPLRQDLALHPAPPDASGAPSWHLHDPAANTFYQISWPAFEILSRWELGSAEDIVGTIAAETTLNLDSDSVAAIAQFLERHHLFATSTAAATGQLAKTVALRRQHWAKRLLHNYLFFRIPLLRPDDWLARHAQYVRPFFAPRWWWIVAGLALLALLLVARRWDEFLHGFSAYSGTESLLAFGLALSTAKIAHELGHGLVARYYGCKVPTMGVAFLVLWPVLYTDTNEAWKLPAHRARAHIALAGMAAESLVALLATWAWLLLPDGPSRAAALFLATTSWVMTLVLNASPFMRFDGYFLLVDTLGLPNLHARAFALGRWWLREHLFGFGDAPPEHFPPSWQRTLILFAIATWLYRLLLFLSIALLVYYAFFKVLGIILMLVEVGWFILRPLVQEFSVWWQRRQSLCWNWPLRRTTGFLLLSVAGIVFPWQQEVSAPAVLAPGSEQTFYAHLPAQVMQVLGAEQPGAKAGEILLQLHSPDLEHRVRQARIAEAAWGGQLERQAFDPQLQAQGEALKRRWEEATAQRLGLEAELARLALRAAFDGEIAYRADGLKPGVWVAARERLLAVVRRDNSKVDVFVGETDLPRLQRDAAARFVPEASEFSRRDCRIADIEPVTLTTLENPEFASTYGGPLAAHVNRNGTLIPVSPIYRVRLDRCQPALAPQLRLRGTAHLDAESRSPGLAALRFLLGVVIRESGF